MAYMVTARSVSTEMGPFHRGKETQTYVMRRFPGRISCGCRIENHLLARRCIATRFLGSPVDFAYGTRLFLHTGLKIIENGWICSWAIP